MPFGFCTREKYPWCEYAEDCETGPSITFIKRVNKEISFIIEIIHNKR